MSVHKSISQRSLFGLRTGDLKDKFRVIGEEDNPAEALEDLKRKKKAEHKRELKKKEEKGKVDKKKAEAELNATLSNLTLPPKSTEPWDVDPGGLPAPGGGPELVVVHRSQLAYVGVEFQETKARAGKTAQSWSLKSGAVWNQPRRVDGVEDDAMIQHERAVKF